MNDDDDIIISKELDKQLKEVLAVIAGSPLKQEFSKEDMQRLNKCAKNLWQYRIKLAIDLVKKYNKDIDLTFLDNFMDYEHLRNIDLEQLMSETDKYIDQAKQKLDTLKNKKPRDSIQIKNQTRLVNALIKGRIETSNYVNAVSEVTLISKDTQKKATLFKSAKGLTKQLVFPAAAVTAGVIIGALAIVPVFVSAPFALGAFHTRKAKDKIRAFKDSTESPTNVALALKTAGVTVSAILYTTMATIVSTGLLVIAPLVTAELLRSRANMLVRDVTAKKLNLIDAIALLRLSNNKPEIYTPKSVDLKLETLVIMTIIKEMQTAKKETSITPRKN